MRNGRYATVDTDAKMKMGTSGQIPDPASVLSDIENDRPELVHDPATGMRISRYVGTENLSSSLSFFTFYCFPLFVKPPCTVTVNCMKSPAASGRPSPAVSLALYRYDQKLPENCKRK